MTLSDELYVDLPHLIHCKLEGRKETKTYITSGIDNTIKIIQFVLHNYKIKEVVILRQAYGVSVWIFYKRFVLREQPLGSGLTGPAPVGYSVRSAPGTVPGAVVTND